MTAHLIHIGYPKAGSTFLQRWFAEHPQFHYREAGIAGFRDVHDLAGRASGADARAGVWVTSSEALSTPHAKVGDTFGDFESLSSRPPRAAQAAACAILKELFPRAHVLLVLRGFRGIWFSAYSQFVRTGGDPRIFSGEAPDPEGSATDENVWDYDHLVGLYREAFGDRLLLLPWELMRDDPEAFTAAIERPFGIAHHAPPGGRFNPALSAVELAWYPLLSRFVRSLPVGDRLRRRLFARYARAANENRLAPLIRSLQRLHPVPPVTPAGITDAMLARFRGTCESLRGEPAFSPYREDYLL